MYFLNMLYNIITRFLTSFTHVFHKKRKGQVVQKSASSWTKNEVRECV